VSDDGTLRIWDVTDRKLLRVISLCKEGLASVAISPNGRYVAAGSNDPYYAKRRLAGTSLEGTITAPDKSCVVYLCDLAGGNTTEIYHGYATAESLAFSADGRTLAVGTRYCEVSLIDLDGKLIGRNQCESRVASLEFLPRSRQLLVPNRISNKSKTFGVAQLWSDDLSTIEHVLWNTGNPGASSQITLARSSPDGEYIVGGQGYRANLALFHFPSQRMVGEAPRFRDRLMDVAFSPNGRLLAAAHRNGAVRILRLLGSDEAVSLEVASVFRAHDGNVSCVRFVTNETLVSCGDDVIRIWNTEDEATRSHDTPGESWDGPFPVPWSDARSGACKGICLSPDGSQILALCNGGIFGIETDTGDLVQHHAISGPHSAHWSRAGDRATFCFATRDIVDVVDAMGNTTLSIKQKATPRDAAFSPSGDRIAIIGDRELQLCSADDGLVLHRRSLESSGSHVAFSPSGKQLAYCGQFQDIAIVDPTSGKYLRKLEGGSDYYGLAFSTDDKLLAAAQNGGAIRIWDTDTGQLRSILVGHDNAVSDVAFSPNGRTLISASDDGTIRLWSVPYGRCYGTLYGDRIGCRISFSADGRHLAVAFAGHDGKPEIWLWHQSSGPVSNDSAN
jgi:WD40 repeat protein